MDKKIIIFLSNAKKIFFFLNFSIFFSKKSQKNPKNHGLKSPDFFLSILEEKSQPVSKKTATFFNKMTNLNISNVKKSFFKKFFSTYTGF